MKRWQSSMGAPISSSAFSRTRAPASTKSSALSAPAARRRDIFVSRACSRFHRRYLHRLVAVIIAGPWALAYIPLYVLATVPGWPLGRALFGGIPPRGSQARYSGTG